MGSLGAPEILVILVVALLVLGPEKLPDAARQAGRALAEIRKMTSGFQADIRDAMQLPETGPVLPAEQSSTQEAVVDTAPTPPQRYLWSDLPGAESTSDSTSTDPGS